MSAVARPAPARRRHACGRRRPGRLQARKAAGAAGDDDRHAAPGPRQGQRRGCGVHGGQRRFLQPDHPGQGGGAGVEAGPGAVRPCGAWRGRGRAKGRLRHRPVVQRQRPGLGGVVSGGRRRDGPRRRRGHRSEHPWRRRRRIRPGSWRHHRDPAARLPRSRPCLLVAGSRPLDSRHRGGAGSDDLWRGLCERLPRARPVRHRRLGFHAHARRRPSRWTGSPCAGRRPGGRQPRHRAAHGPDLDRAGRQVQDRRRGDPSDPAAPERYRQ